MAVAGVFRLPATRVFALKAAQAFEGVEAAAEFEDEVGQFFLQKAVFVDAYIGQRCHAQVEGDFALVFKVGERFRKIKSMVPAEASWGS